MLRIVKWPLMIFLRRPLVYISKKVSASPDREHVFARLDELYEEITCKTGKHKDALFETAFEGRTLVILSDHHKGNRRGGDEFRYAEGNYLAALDYYNGRDSYYVNLGDSEEFWKFNIFSILKNNKATFEKEKAFVERNAFFKIYGNHDTFWRIDPLAPLYLKQAFGKSIPIYDGIVIRVKQADGRKLDLFCTHGHQGDKRSDGNKFSVWFVTYIWGPLQTFLEININTPAANEKEKTLHNRIMYAWSKTRENMVLITGHTHQAIFPSYHSYQRLSEELAQAEQTGTRREIKRLKEKIARHQGNYAEHHNPGDTYIPSYFNTGCCCYSDRSITGIELSDGHIRLVRWNDPDGASVREVVEELPLATLVDGVASGIKAK